VDVIGPTLRAYECYRREGACTGALGCVSEENRSLSRREEGNWQSWGKCHDLAMGLFIEVGHFQANERGF
jgi:hypothetical protein